MNKHSLEWFWDGCEAVGPFPIGVKLPGQPQTQGRVLAQPFAVVGRDARAHLKLEGGGVGLRHAYLQVLAGQLFVVDLGSQTGIATKAGPIRAGWVPARDPVGIGSYWLRWEQGAAPDPGMALPGFDPLAEPPPGESLVPLSLQFLNGKHQPHWKVDRALTLIGSSAACKVRLRSSRVSDFHCSLIWTPRGAWIVDLLGEGGARLNGVPVPFASLEHDDRLQVGEFVIRVCCGAPSSGEQAAAGGYPSMGSLVNGKQPGQAPAGSPAALSIRGSADLFHPSGAMRFPALAPPDAVTDPAHAALAPIITQFGAIQEQMADQFRQTLMMMFQMFSALHKDQMAFFQQEMERVHELTQELHFLQTEAAKHAPRPTPAGPRPAAEPVPARPSPAPQATPAPADFPLPPASSPSPASPPPPAPEATPNAPAPAGQDIHVWLCQRMAAVQEERQNRWQKLLALLGGKRTEEN